MKLTYKPVPRPAPPRPAPPRLTPTLVSAAAMLPASVCGLGAAAPTDGKTVTNGPPSVVGSEGTHSSVHPLCSCPKKSPDLQRRNKK
ncbi:hypothetical protein E2C01_040329 [Portunus trituberculatus]|uniref:Uncharacterized protein n=1 Tax=Portunus trituberculatus TaxID=210409 RepID=A0A5B7FM98_PORTR|nr:hypothetical protein [Portunus trituberculatus]